MESGSRLVAINVAGRESSENARISGASETATFIVGTLMVHQIHYDSHRVSTSWHCQGSPLIALPFINDGPFRRCSHITMPSYATPGCVGLVTVHRRFACFFAYLPIVRRTTCLAENLVVVEVHSTEVCEDISPSSEV